MTDTDIARVPRTIAELPFFASGRHPKPDLLGRCSASGIAPIAGGDLVERVRDLGLGLAGMGIGRGTRVALMADSRPEWVLTDLAVLALGGVVVPVYPTLAVEQVVYLLQDSGARHVVVSTPDLLEKVAAASREVPLESVILMDSEGASADGIPVPVTTLAEVADAGHRRITDGWGVAKEFQDGAKAVNPDDLATIIYTSGTTGRPKGVMLSHANLTSNIEGVLQVVDMRHDDTALSFLPLCHGFERMVAFVYLTQGVSMIFAESMETIARDLKVVRPHIMTAVPRVFEKLQARILENGRANTGLKRVIFERAVALAGERGRRLVAGEPLSALMRLESAVAERVVFSKIREAVGGRLRYAVSGSAALRRDLGEFFYGVGLPIIEGYGLTETAPVLCVTPLDAIRFGTVGRPLPNVEIRIADDGEILAKGPNVMLGYLNRPEETAEVLRDGWFHTGDIGEMDDGYLRITDRKKDLIVLSSGKKIAPQPIEAALKAHPLIAEAIVVGEKRNYGAALLVPDAAALARRLGRAVPDEEAARRALYDGTEVQQLFEGALEEVNGGLARFEQLKRFRLLARELSVAGGELTPTLKVKRPVVEQRFADDIRALYA